MNTNYDDEATQYQGADNEETQYEGTSTKVQSNQTSSPTKKVEVKGAKKSGWKRVAVGAGSGLLIGGVATVLMGMKKADSDIGQQESDNHKEELSHPEWVDNQIQVATSVNDDMPFGEAFAAARAEVGPGGCFEWHGNVYGTYTADEWNNMTADQRADFGDHFSWNHIDHSSSNVAQHSTTAAASHTAQSTHTANDGGIEVAPENHENNANDVAHQETGTGNSADALDDPALVSDTEPEIEILGVVHDDDYGANIGGISVDGQEIVLIDVDGNMEFDYMASDINGNEQIDPNEIVDIQDQGLTVNDLGGFSDTTDDMSAFYDDTDSSYDIFNEG